MMEYNEKQILISRVISLLFHLKNLEKVSLEIGLTRKDLILFLENTLGSVLKESED